MTFVLSYANGIITNRKEFMTNKKDDIRLNAPKRKALKDAWRDVVLKRTPTEKEDVLRKAVADFKELETSVWDSIVYPAVEKNYPQDDMRVMQKYSRNDYGGGFTVWDSCFYFKPSFSDDQEKQFRWAYDKEDMTAMYYDDLMNVGVNPNLYEEFEGKDSNPYFYEQEKQLDGALDNLNVAKYDTSKSGNSRSWNQYRDTTINDSDVPRLDGHALLVPQTGGCNTRVMMVDSEYNWKQLNDYEKSRTIMCNSQREIFKEKITLIRDMNMVIDQAKFISEVKPYWADLEDCVNLDDQNIGTAVSIVSEETKQRLLDSAKLRQAERDIVAVITTPKKSLDE